MTLKRTRSIGIAHSIGGIVVLGVVTAASFAGDSAVAQYRNGCYYISGDTTAAEMCAIKNGLANILGIEKWVVLLLFVLSIANGVLDLFGGNRSGNSSETGEESEQINAGSAQPPAKEQFTEEPASAGAKSQVYGSTMVARTTKTFTLSRSIRDRSYLAIFGLMVLICWDASSLLWGLIYIGTWIANFAVTRQSTRLEFGARRIVGMFTIFIASVTILKAFYDTILDNYHSSILDGNTFLTLRFTEILPITMIKSPLRHFFEAPVVLVLAIVFLWVTIVRLRSDSARARQSR